VISARPADMAAPGRRRGRNAGALASVSFAVMPVEGVADALAGGAGLAVDAVGVDLEQDGDAAAGAAGDFSDRHAGVEPSHRETAAWRRS